MKHRIYALVLAAVMLFPAPAMTQEMGDPQRDDTRMQWWREARFGMFIHWGLYAILGGAWDGRTDYGEWIRNNARIPIDTYDTLRGHFNPVHFDADEWVSLAKRAGMRYIVLTTKHHDGFCLFDSEHTDFDVMATPFKRDIVAELADACRNHGIVFGLYHSIMDWHHPDYLPRRIWETDRSADGADYERYVSYMKAQVKELLTAYGPIGILWFDGEWESTWTEAYGTDMYTYVRGLQPDIIVNNRVGASREGMAGTTASGKFGGDFGTPEQQVPATGMPGVDWESCMTMNENWGFNEADTNFKSATELIRTLIDIASKGGNFLLNVGPTAAGTFPDESILRLKQIGDWMKVHGESIYGTMAGPFEKLSWGRCTQKTENGRTTLYLHVFDRPEDGELRVPGLLTTPRKSSILGDPARRALRMGRNEDALMIRLPDTALPDGDLVIALEYDGTPDVMHPPAIVPGQRIFVDTLTVFVRSGRDGIDIRYTLDGSSPTIRSPLTTGSIVLSESARIAVRNFRGQDPVSSSSFSDVMKHMPYPAVRLTEDRPGISYAYYEGDWDRLPDFRQLRPLRQGTLPGFSFEPRGEEEHFGFLYEGYVSVPVTGVYTFFTSSDDGSRLWVHDSLVVDNDGLHGSLERSGEIALERGYHPLRVAYFEKTGGDALSISVRGPGVQKRMLSERDLQIGPVRNENE